MSVFLDPISVESHALAPHHGHRAEPLHPTRGPRSYSSGSLATDATSTGRGVSLALKCELPRTYGVSRSRRKWKESLPSIPDAEIWGATASIIPPSDSKFFRFSTPSSQHQLLLSSSCMRDSRHRTTSKSDHHPWFKIRDKQSHSLSARAQSISSACSPAPVSQIWGSVCVTTTSFTKCIL